jgi:hypothetical protein
LRLHQRSARSCVDHPRPFSELEELEVAAVPLAGNSLADSNVKKPRHEAEDAALATRL